MILHCETPPARSDAELARAAQDGDKGAFVEIVARHQSMVSSVTLAVLGDFAASEDAAQEAFLIAWRKLQDLRDVGKLRGWLAHIARNAALGHLRCNRPTHALQRAEELPGHTPAPDQAAVASEDATLIREALTALPEKYRLTFILYYREDQSVQEVAKALQMSEDAIRQRLARGRELLRGRLAGLIETMLTETRPGAVFTISVAAAIGAGATATTFAGGAGACAASVHTTSTTLAPPAVVMTLSKISITTAAVLTAGGFFLGRLTVTPEIDRAPERPQPAAAADGESSRGQLATLPKKARAPREPSATKADAWRRMPPGSERAAALTETANGVLFEKNPARRLRLFSEFIEHFQPADFEAVAASFAYHDQQGRLFGPEYELFLATAAMVDGEAAMKQIFKEGAPMDRQPFAAQHSAMTAWAVEEPQNAVGWWNALPEGVTKDELARSLISGVAATDINYAWRCLNAFPETERAKFMGSLVRQQIADGGAESAARWLGALQSDDGSDAGPLKQKGFDSLLKAAVNISPATKSEYISQFAGESWMQQSDFPARVAEQWARQDGNRAAEWAGGLPEAVRTNALVPALRAWSQRNSLEFEAWRATHEADPRFRDSINLSGELAKAQPTEG